MAHALRISGLILLALCLGWQSAAAADDAALIQKILGGIEKRYAGKGFRAKFFQESMLKAMMISDTAEGRLIVKRPGKMRWEYLIPDEQTIITDGKSMWIYRPADKQVMVGKAPEFFSGGKGAGFLSDIRQIRKSFDVQLQKSKSPDHFRLRLLPKSPTADLADIILSVNRSDFLVQQVLTYNSYGDETRIEFSEYQFNQNPKDSLFTFIIPDGIDVVQIDQP
ncbi:MAG: outer membrane lipoprotein chaperone LolA [Desulfobacteraceae bacterium]|jgi:outer membrane lipoprotein carrier protein